MYFLTRKVRTFCVGLNWASSRPYLICLQLVFCITWRLNRMKLIILHTTPKQLSNTYKLCYQTLTEFPQTEKATSYKTNLTIWRWRAVLSSSATKASNALISRLYSPSSSVAAFSSSAKTCAICHSLIHKCTYIIKQKTTKHTNKTTKHTNKSHKGGPPLHCVVVP